MKQTAAKTARGASAVIDGMTACMVKGATAGNPIAGTINRVVERTRNWTIQAAQMAAHDNSMEASGRALAKAHDIATDAFQNVEAAGQKGNAPSRLAAAARELRSAHVYSLTPKGRLSAKSPQPVFGSEGSQ